MLKLSCIILMLAYSSLTFADTSSAEKITADYLLSIQNDPQKLLVFLQNMPKGADLHYHLGSGGTSLAENLMSYGFGEQFCIDRKDFTVYKNINCSKDDLLDSAMKNASFYNQLIDSWSMRNFKPIHESAHDHFFASFGKIDALASPHYAEIIAESMNRAALQNESYLELMWIPDNNASSMLGKKIGWNDNLTQLRQTLLSNGLNDIVIDMQKNVDRIEAKLKTILACGTAKAEPGCSVKIAYLYEGLRNQPPEQIFAQMLAAFEIASKDPRFVGINLVQPEDGNISMRDYHLQMEMIAFLHTIYPNVHIALHAGELNSSLVPTKGLRFHIREAVEIGHAERIGHGVDIPYENSKDQLLKEMANNHIVTEINLSSNEAILNIKYKSHPLPLYLSHHVPVVLSTDDEGILRTTLTIEYQKAILRYHLSYATIKEMARNSIYFSFIPGKNLWTDSNYKSIIKDCAADTLGSSTPSKACQLFLNSNPKANAQWDLESRFMKFESDIEKIAQH